MGSNPLLPLNRGVIPIILIRNRPFLLFVADHHNVPLLFSYSAILSDCDFADKKARAMMI